MLDINIQQKIGKHIKIYSNKEKNYVSLFNPYTLKNIYLKKNIYKNISEGYETSLEITDELRSLGFLEQEGYVNEIIMKLNKQMNTSSEENGIFILKLFLTTRCNFNCKYCLIEQNIQNRNLTKKDLNENISFKIIDDFIDVSADSNKKNKIIMFYGGEPLLNWECLKKTIEYIRNAEKSGMFNGVVELILETNGSLITKDKADVLAKNNVSIIISLDGPPEVHNSMRIYKDDLSGTFDDVMRGLKAARDSGCTVVTSAVFHKNVAASIDEVIKYMATVVKTPSTGLDLLHVLDGKENPGDVDSTLSGIYYINAFKVAREYGLYIEHIMRRIRPFIEEKIRLRDCGACGSRIVATPEGEYGQCEGLIHSKKYYNKIKMSMRKFTESNAYESWKNRNHFNYSECRNCEAIGICGGGCPYNSYIVNGTIDNIDKKTCDTSIDLLRFMIWDLYEIMEIEENGKNLIVPTIEDKKKILKSIPFYLDLPLIKTYSQMMEASTCI